MAVVNSYQRDVLHRLGYSDFVISEMTQAVVSDIVADYNNGIERPANVANVANPSDVFVDTFVGGVSDDVVDITMELRDGLAAAGQTVVGLVEELPETVGALGEGARKLFRDAPLVVAGVALFAVWLFIGKG